MKIIRFIDIVTDEEIKRLVDLLKKKNKDAIIIKKDFPRFEVFEI